LMDAIDHTQLIEEREFETLVKQCTETHARVMIVWEDADGTLRISKAGVLRDIIDDVPERALNQGIELIYLDRGQISGTPIVPLETVKGWLERRRHPALASRADGRPVILPAQFAGP
ncbi:MAG: hypothetical protein B7Z14_09290, partial [Bosea sp. 32-68-6]